MRWARATVITLICVIPLVAYVPRRVLTPSGVAMEKWSPFSFPIVWRLNPTKGDNVTGGRDVTAVVREAFAAWSGVTAAAVSFSEGLPANGTVAALDGINLITFMPSNFAGSAISQTVIYSVSIPAPGQFPGQILEADILLNPNALFSTEVTPPADRYDLQGAIVHEIGHLLGLDHSPLVSAVMFATPQPGRTSWRQLTTDDTIGLANLYPNSSIVAALGSARGRVRTTQSEGVVAGHVVITDATGKPVVSTLTDTGGNYEVHGLAPGSYAAYVEPVEGVAFPTLQPASGFTTRFAVPAADVPGNLTLTKTAGDGQTGFAGEPLATMIEVQAMRNGTAAAGVPVSFRSASGDGAVVPLEGVTDSQGRMRATIYLGKAASQTFRASAEGIAATFSAVAQPRTVSNISFLDSSTNTSTKELIVNAGNTVAAPLRILDVNGTVRSDIPATYRSLDTGVATVDASGNVLGVKAGFATITVSAGGAVTAATVTVVEVRQGAAGFEATSVAQDSGQRVYLVNSADHTVRTAVEIGQNSVTYAGISQTPGLTTNAPRLQSLFKSPTFVALNQADGSLYVSDSGNHVIRRVVPGPDGRVEIVAGTGLPGAQNGSVQTATFNNPQGIALDNRGRLWVVDSGNHVIRRINLAAKTVETVAGLAGTSGATDGSAAQSRFSSPVGIALEPESVDQQLERFFAGGSPSSVRMLVADTGNGLIRRVKENGDVETLPAGATASAVALDSDKSVSFQAGTPAQFAAPSGVAVDPAGNIYLSEKTTGQVKVILRTGDIVPAVQPNTFTSPQGLAVSRSGRVIVAAANRPAHEIRYGEPSILSVAPSTVRAIGGARITIDGSNFAPDSIVIVGGTVIRNLQIVDTHTLTFVAPPLPSGRVVLTVQNRGGLAQTALFVDATLLSELPQRYITTVAGGSTFAGEGASALAAPMMPAALAFGANGNLFIADEANRRIRRIDSRTGTVITVAGNGQLGKTGDGGSAIAASLSYPNGLAFDAAGNLLIADGGVRKVDAVTGVITTVLRGEYGFCGDGLNALNACFDYITGIATDKEGNLFIADRYNNRIRRVDAATSIITTIAGNGQGTYGGDQGIATAASIKEPFAVIVDDVRRFLYIADSGNNRVRKVDLQTGTITTVAGGGSPPSGSIGDGGQATAASLGFPTRLALDAAGNLFIADRDNERVRRVDIVTGVITTVAGGGTPAEGIGDGGAATAAIINEPWGVAVDGAGNIVIAHIGAFRVRKVDAATQIISSIAGTGQRDFPSDGGLAVAGTLPDPVAVNLDSSGNLYITDSSSGRIRKVDATTRIVTTIAGGGNPAQGIGDNGPATSARLNEPRGRVVFDAQGNLYIADRYNYRVRMINKNTGAISTIAGSGGLTSSGDNGPATQAGVLPDDLAMDRFGNLYIAEGDSGKIRKVNLASGTITTIAANLAPKLSIAVDPDGNLYIAEPDNARIRKFNVTTQAFTTVVQGGLPLAVATDAAGTLFFIDFDYPLGVKMLSGTTATQVAGKGEPVGLGDNGPAIDAFLYYPRGIAIDSAGNLFIADTDNHRIRAVRGPLN